MKINKHEPLEVVSDLVDIAGRLTSTTVVVAGGERIEDLKLVEAAQDHGIIDRIILVGNKQKISNSIDATGISINPEDIVHTEDDDHTAAATVRLIEDNVVDIVLKGNISTPIINRHMLRLATRSTVSLASIFDAAPIAGGRPMILTDAGVTTVCNFGRLTDLINNAVDVAQVVMGIERPRVALLSANEKQVPSLPSTWLGLELAERSWNNAIVCGPLSFDLATDTGSVEIKGMPKLPNAVEVAGQADILVCPGIDAANILYKAIASMAKYGAASIAGITVGFPVPYIILSRSDPLETRLQSIALCSIYAAGKSDRKKDERDSIQTQVEKKNILALGNAEQKLKGAVFSNARCTCEFEITGTGSTEDRQSADSIQKIKSELDRCDVGKLDAVACMVTHTGEFSGIDPDQLYILPESGEPEYRFPLSRLLTALSKEYSAPAYVSASEIIPNAGPHARNLMSAARFAADSADKPLESLKYITVYIDAESSVCVIEKGDFSYYIEHTMTDFNKDIDAFLLAVAREIGAAFVHASCDIEGIILTGPMLRDKSLGSGLRSRVGRLAPVTILDKNMDLAVLSASVLDTIKNNTDLPVFHGKEN